MTVGMDLTLLHMTGGMDLVTCMIGGMDFTTLHITGGMDPNNFSVALLSLETKETPPPPPTPPRMRSLLTPSLRRAYAKLAPNAACGNTNLQVGPREGDRE